MFTDVQDFIPRLATIGRFVETAITAARPKRPFGSDVNRVRVLRMDCNPTNVLRMLQAKILPAFPAILRLIDAVAVTDTALRIAFARSNPDHQRISWIEFHIADGIGPLMLKDRTPRCTVVLSLPHSAGGGGNVVLCP